MRLDDEDFELYLNRKVYAIDLEEDDDTMNVRFDNHDTQWFPVSCLYQEGASSSSSPNGKRKQMTMDTIKERKYYFGNLHSHLWRKSLRLRSLSFFFAQLFRIVSYQRHERAKESLGRS